MLAFWQQGDEAAARQVAVASMLGILAYFVVFGALSAIPIGADAARFCFARGPRPGHRLSLLVGCARAILRGVTPSKPNRSAAGGLTDYPKEAKGESEGRGQGRPSGMARDGR